MKRRQDRAARPEHYAAIERKRHAKHKAARNANCRAYWFSNHEKSLEALRLRMLANRDAYNAARRADADMDRESAREKGRRWREANKDRLNAARRLWWKSATRQQRLRIGIGAAISHSLKGSGKGGRGWQEIVGYTVEDLMIHLSKQFVRGMSWANYGSVWHVDHIVPVASFRYESAEDAEFVECWSLSNLRPLWSRDNMSKGARKTHLL